VPEQLSHWQDVFTNRLVWHTNLNDTYITYTGNPGKYLELVPLEFLCFNFSGQGFFHTLVDIQRSFSLQESAGPLHESETPLDRRYFCLQRIQQFCEEVCQLTEDLEDLKMAQVLRDRMNEYHILPFILLDRDNLNLHLRSLDMVRWTPNIHSSFALHSHQEEQRNVTLTTFLEVGDVVLSMVNHQCTICSLEFNVHQPLLLLNVCQHLFHEHCVNKWLLKNPSCPLCRSSVFQFK
jgi:hypothetical protein